MISAYSHYICVFSCDANNTCSIIISICTTPVRVTKHTFNTRVLAMDKHVPFLCSTHLVICNHTITGNTVYKFINNHNLSMLLPASLPGCYRLRSTRC
jgi:hypothetical protein